MVCKHKLFSHIYNHCWWLQDWTNSNGFRIEETNRSLTSISVDFYQRLINKYYVACPTTCPFYSLVLLATYACVRRTETKNASSLAIKQWREASTKTTHLLRLPSLSLAILPLLPPSARTTLRYNWNIWCWYLRLYLIGRPFFPCRDVMYK